MNILGIDIALRNTACVALNDKMKCLNYKVLTSSKSKYDGEGLLLYNYSVIKELYDEVKPDFVYFEGLSLGSVSLAKDVIAGNFWYLRTRLYNDTGKLVKVVVPTSWRANVFTKHQKEALSKIRKNTGSYGKDTLKKVALSHVPKDLRVEFKKYLTDNKLAGKFMYDLSDAYCICKYGIKVNNES